eukprot:scaffold115_cov241-Pinguiococcus_pyrenoidosus.AAC.9
MTQREKRHWQASFGPGRLYSPQLALATHICGLCISRKCFQRCVLRVLLCVWRRYCRQGKCVWISLYLSLRTTTQLTPAAYRQCFKR